MMRYGLTIRGRSLPANTHNSIQFHGCSVRQFSTDVLHGCSVRQFSTDVLHGCSVRQFSTDVLQGCSVRQFSTDVLQGCSVRQFSTDVLQSEVFLRDLQISQLCSSIFRSSGISMQNVRLMVPDILKDSNIFVENNPVIPVCQEVFTY